MKRHKRHSKFKFKPLSSLLNKLGEITVSPVTALVTLGAALVGAGLFAIFKGFSFFNSEALENSNKTEEPTTTAEAGQSKSFDTSTILNTLFKSLSSVGSTVNDAASTFKDVKKEAAKAAKKADSRLSSAFRSIQKAGIFAFNSAGDMTKQAVNTASTAMENTRNSFSN